MKSENNLYGCISAFENIHLAYKKARRNKRMKSDIIKFGQNLEENLLNICNHLQYETYAPDRYHEFYVCDPKVRLILSLPFKDRVVHQAICNVIEPVFEQRFIQDSYACRKNKGTQAGLKRVAYFLNKIKTNNKKAYCLKMDIKKYFYSIDHDVLKRTIRRKISCRKTLKLLDIIIDSIPNPGLPVGNLTSQLFANIYLDQTDHFIKEVLRAKYYVRYMDDMVILHEDKAQLWHWHEQIKEFLSELKLELNHKTSVFPVDLGIDFLGYRQFDGYRILRKRILKKNYRKFKSFRTKNASPAKIYDSLKSLTGLLSYCSAYKIIRNIKNILGEEKWEQVYSGRPKTTATH